MIEKAKISDVLGRLREVEAAMGDPDVIADAKRYRAVVGEHAALRKLESAAMRYFKILDDIEGNESLLDDPDFAEEAKREIERLKGEEPEAERAVLAGLLPPDPLEGRNAVFEVRAGTGGDEAALFAGDLFRMYSRYCEAHGWKVHVMGANETSLDGYKEILFTVEGEGAYGAFRFESGGHRVQRVPETEAQGRIHTSAATVIVFPEADEAEDDIDIPEKDLRIDIFCAGGHGGQGVNTTYSAIRMTHLPTGLVAQCQDERSQQRNKEKCLATLKARIIDQRRREEEAKAGASRLSLRGSGDRSERIRTYNFPQNRLTDHRVDLTLYSLDRIMEGALDPVLDALRSRDTDQRISAALSEKA
ncbi:MAG: peptide chain release factor 1 [Kiritimatiellae bacterium]|nr:peptide chain release factor 1 [Kiritimatiellia bacterium]